jgi:hypothetical protein
MWCFSPSSISAGLSIRSAPENNDVLKNVLKIE